jgi:hypothetical protein
VDDDRDRLNGLPKDLWRSWAAGTLTYAEAAREAMLRELRRNARRETPVGK